MVSRRIALALVAVGTVACELIVGIGPEPHLADGGDAEAGPPTCVLPTTGDAQVRLANVVPSLDRYDFCLTLTGTQAPQSGVLASSGSGCPVGLLYRNVLAPFAVKSGSYRVDAVAPGAACSSAPLATAPNVNFDPSTTTTVVLFGTGGGAQLQLKAFREETGLAAEPKARLINGWSDGPPTLECGITTSDELPATIIPAQLFGQNAGFTDVSPAANKVDSLGYFTLLGDITVPFGFAQTGKGTTGVAIARNMTAFSSLSLFAIGTSADPRFPVDLMVCNQLQNDGVFTRCSNQIADDVIVDVYNVQLQGRFVPVEPDRRVAVANAIAGLDADFACITELWDPIDKQAIIAAAKTHFPFVATFTTDLSTVPNDPRDQTGTVPPPYTTPACGSSSASLSQGFLSCLAAKGCTTGAPNDMNGACPENAEKCIVNNCLIAGANLIADPGCYSCVVTQVESGVTFANVQTACTTNPLARYAYNGDIGVLLLSTHPFLPGGAPTDGGVEAGGDGGDGGDGGGGLPSDDGPGLLVFPSTEYRAAAIRAPVDLSTGSGLSTKVDVYCTILTTPVTSAQRPYVGNYGGGGATSGDQWLNENILQATQLTNYVTRVSAARGRRAIIAGDYYTGPALGSLQALNPTSFATLTTVLPLATAPDYTPACTYCGDNPLLAAAGANSTKTWSSYSLLSNLAVPEVLGNTVILKDLTATTNLNALGVDGGTLAIPPSFYYGMRTVVRVRP